MKHLSVLLFLNQNFTALTSHLRRVVTINVTATVRLLTHMPIRRIDAAAEVEREVEVEAEHDDDLL